MRQRFVIPFAWCRRAITFCRGRLWRGCIILSSTLVALLAGSWWAIEWPAADAAAYPGGVVLRDRAGGVLRVSLGPGDVDCRPYYAADPDDLIVKALVAAEDGTFWTHGGVRPLSVVRAAFQNLAAGRRVSGASTLTMQAVRLIRPHPKTFAWKFREAVMALKMERAKDKRWILSQYLNRAPFGANFVGIEAAASGWFGKSAHELGLGEAALLAGMVQAPSRYRPDRNLERALKRRDYVLGRMLATGVITREQMDGARSVRPIVCRAPRPFKAPHYCDWFLKGLGRKGEGQRLGGDFTTALDADIQSQTESAVGAAAEAGGYSVAAVVMSVRSGHVLALACSGDYFDPVSGQVNTALAPRPAGSTLKPLLTALALDKGVVTPCEKLDDAPMSFRGYRPANFDGAYRGPVSVRDALILSLNIPFVRLLERVGVETFATSLRSLGFALGNASDETFGLGLAIGNAEVSLLELVGAYAKLARGEAFGSGAGYVVSDMLSGNERSRAALGHVADVKASRFAWKTGTSAAYRDAWTVAWNPDYAVGVWCGHKSGGFGDRTLVGAKAAAPVAWKIARALYPRDDGPWFVRPASVVAQRVCAATGLPAGPWCPHTLEGVALRGVSAGSLCALHRFGEERPVKRSLAILRPEDGAKFVLTPNLAQQRLVCRAAGQAEDASLWWLVDGRLAGTSKGTKPFALPLTPGSHRITCATASGETSEVSISVASPASP